MPVICKNKEKSEELIKEIASLLDKITVPIRLSLAGGEPMLDKKIKQKIEYAYKLGLKISLITNGDLLTDEFISETATKLAMIGVSIDSFDEERNLKIGRHEKNKVPDYDKINTLLQKAKKINPELKIKINTVVNKFNYEDDLREGIKNINPDKYKVLRVLPATEKSKNSTITDEQFEIFKQIHKNIKNITFEDNEDMKNSYLMIDPFGRFFYNIPDAKYGHTKPILKVGIQKALQEVDFDADKFNKRY